MPRFLSRLLRSAAPAADPVSDAELLRRFAADRDSAALELVVRRHAGAVWAACRRVLPREADAEDAFQAAFLALVRRAGAVRGPCAGGWLHRVAVRAALRLRDRAARAPDATNPDPPAAGSLEPDSDLAAVVHEELDRLPDRERLPLILCDLEGLSHADAAATLGWPVGTVSGRLSRARAKLRERLARRGLNPAAAALPLAVAPPALVSKAVSLTSNPATPAVASLAEGVLRAMVYAKLKAAAVIAACAGLVLAAGVGTGLALAPGPVPVAPEAEPVAAQPPKAEPPKAAAPPPKAADETKDANALTLFPELTADGLADLGKACPILFGKDENILPKDPPRRQLLKAMLNTARAGLRATTERYQGGGATMQEVGEAAERVLVAAGALDQENLVPALKERVRVAKMMEKVVELRMAAGAAPRAEVLQARYQRLSAELALIDAIEAAKRPK